MKSHAINAMQEGQKRNSIGLSALDFEIFELDLDNNGFRPLDCSQRICELFPETKNHKSVALKMPE